MKKIRLIAVFLVAVFVMDSCKNIVLKAVVTNRLSGIVGSRVHIGKFKLGILAGTIQIQDLRIQHPNDFERGQLLYAPLISAKINPFSILKGEPHVPELVVDIRDVMIIRNKSGKLNVDSLNVSQGKPVSESGKHADRNLSLRLDRLDLSIHRVIYKDYTAKDKAKIEVHQLGIKNAEYLDIKNGTQLVSLILFQSLKSSAVKGAMIYGASAVVGMSVLPVSTTFALTGKSDVEAEFKDSYSAAYRSSLKAIKALGELVSADKESGHIKAKIAGCNTEIQIIKSQANKILINVSSKKLMIPRAKIAAGLLYQIEQYLK